jgi:hypothetical protein
LSTTQLTGPSAPLYSTGGEVVAHAVNKAAITTAADGRRREFPRRGRITDYFASSLHRIGPGGHGLR